MSQCFFCHQEVVIAGRIGRSETCPSCQRDLHICRNCQFYAPGAYNECHESQAEPVLDKERANFCDYFSFAPKTGAQALDTVAKARRELEALFKK